MMLTSCGGWNAQTPLSAGRGNGASESCGVLDSAATSSTAIDVGVVLEPMITSTLSSDTSLRAFFDAAVGSVASSSTM